MRRGISLLEVLIAIFVILVGLLGVVALIPLGHSSMLKATQHDRARTLAASSIQEVQTRGWIRPEWWCWPDGTDFDETTFVRGVVAIDPLYSASHGTTPGVNLLPLGNANGLARLSLWAVPPDTGMTPPFPVPIRPMSAALVDRLFRSNDDLLFAKQDDARPIAVPGATTSVDYKGEYSWFATITASLSGSATPFADNNPVSVATAVCYQRDVANEVAVLANVVWPPGVFIGELDLVFASQSDADVMGDTKWIALLRTDGMGIQWYELMSVEDVDSTAPLRRRVYIEGADWPVDATQPAPYPLLPARAILIPSVLSVRTANVSR